MQKNREKFYFYALLLAIFTISYNLGEGLISIFLGYQDETLSLFGFGVDSFVEVISGIGILHMLLRIKKNPDKNPDYFEKTALKITGGSFYLLSIGLILSGGFIIYYNTKPESTFWGIIISAVSICSMWLLVKFKIIVGKRLDSEAILADAACTMTCVRLSYTLFLASLIYELTGIGYIDVIGSFIIAWLSFKEGKESFEKTRNQSVACCCGGKCH